MIQAVLFDFFGTLVHYSPSRVDQGYHKTHQLLQDFGVILSYEQFLQRWVAVAESLDQWSRRTGLEYSMKQLVDGFLKDVGMEAVSPTCTLALWSSYLEEWGSAIRYISGARELVEELCHASVRVGVVSNTHSSELIQQHLMLSGLAPFIEVVVTSVEHGRPKPHASIFAAALRQLGCSASAALFVGDSYEADYLGAKRAGMQALLIDESGAPQAPRGDVISSLLQVRERVFVKTVAPSVEVE